MIKLKWKIKVKRKDNDDDNNYNNYNDNNDNSEGCFTKSLKFDRYEIPIPNDDNSDKSKYKHKNSSEKSSGSDGENGVTFISTKKKLPTALPILSLMVKVVNQEGANALL